MARRPVNQPYTITTEFGVPDGYALFGKHSGVDYAVNLNRPVYAPASGQLTNVVSKTGGNMVVIFDGKYYHRLMHNSSFSRGNGAVNEGDEVAKAGTTGLSTGVHVHWDINTQGTYPTSFNAFINPADWLNSNPQGGNMPSLTNNGDVENLYIDLLDRKPDVGSSGWVNQPWPNVWYAIKDSPEGQGVRIRRQAQKAFYDKYVNLIGELESRPTKAQLDEIVTKLNAEAKKVEQAEAKAKEAEYKVTSLEQDKAESMKVGERFLQWIGSLFKKG